MSKYPELGYCGSRGVLSVASHREHTEIRNNPLVTRDALDAFLLQGNSSGMPMDALIQLPTDLPLRET